MLAKEGRERFGTAPRRIEKRMVPRGTRMLGGDYEHVAPC